MSNKLSRQRKIASVSPPRDDAATGEPRMLVPTQNCWRAEHAQRAAFLVDGDTYFSAFRAAAINARRSIFVVGWDLDSRTVLTHDADDGFPVRLGELLDTLIHRRRGLEVYILNWDFTMLYAPDRELLPAFKLGWNNRRRLHFHLDGEHPVGASHHQKVVVIDDALAFVGGFDLSECRWDTSAHGPSEKRRCDRNGVAYPPFHDVQMMVDGDAAAALGQLARERWRRATGCTPRAAMQRPSDPWPESIAADMTDVDVGIARTGPAIGQYPAVQEVKQLYLDSIAAARRFIYIENQYLTAHAVANALAQRLREPHGPEIVIVSRLRGGGWLERNTMTVLRARLLKSLRAADLHGRLRVYYPDHSELGDQPIDLHSKLMIVDDRLVRIGSANLNNRSMGVDTECDLAIEATDADGTRAIARLRDRLLGEHLGVEPEAVAEALQARGDSPIGAIESLQGNARSLKPLFDEIIPEIDALVPDAAVIDPEEPIDPERLMDELIPTETHAPARKRIVMVVGVLLAVAALAAAWSWGPLKQWISPATLAHAAGAIADSPLAPLWVLGGYLVASLTAMPITVLIAATVMIFGPFVGFGYALAGSLLGALLTFGIGQLIGQRTVRRLAGARINRLSRRLGRRGILAVLATRMIPVAPFTIVNLVAGASHIRLRDYLIGTVLGMAPGMLAITVFSDRLAATLRNPSPTTVAILALATLLLSAGGFAMHAWLKRGESSRVNEQSSSA